MNFLVFAIVLAVFTGGCTACQKGERVDQVDYVSYFAEENEKKFIAAIMAGDKETMKDAARQGTNLNCIGRYENTPLAVAVKVGKKDVLKLLLSLGADPNYITPEGVAAAEDAVTLQKDPEVLEILLNHGLNPNLTSEGVPLIFFTASQSDWAKYEMLLRRGADINAKNTDGSSLVYRLVAAFEYQRAKDLILKGADTTTVNVNGGSVIDDLADAQRRFCGDLNLPDCRSRETWGDGNMGGRR